MTRHAEILRLLAQARPERLEPGPDRLDLAAITAYPRERAARSPRPARRLVLAGLVPTVAAGALAVTVVAVRPQPPAPGPGPVASAPADVRQLLLAAAELTERAGTSSGRYWVSRTESGQAYQFGAPDNRYTVVARSREETWWTRSGDGNRSLHQPLGAGPASPRDQAAWRRDGAPASWVRPGPKGTEPTDPRERARLTISQAAGDPYVQAQPAFVGFSLAGHDVTWSELDRLPSDPAALRDLLLRDARQALGARGYDENVYAELLFSDAVQLAYRLPVSAPVRAAAYRMLAGMPGLRDLGTVTDQGGRTGTAVAVTIRGEGPGGRSTQEERLILDPKTGTPLATETRVLDAQGAFAWLAGGGLLRYSLVRGAAWTDDAPPAASPGK